MATRKSDADVQRDVRDELDVFRTHMPGHFAGVVRGLMAHAGVEVDNRFINTARLSTEAGASPRSVQCQAALEVHQEDILGRTAYSERLNDAEVGLAQRYVNAYLAHTSNRLLKQHPPAGPLAIIVDGHYRESSSKPFEKDPKHYVAPTIPDTSTPDLQVLHTTPTADVKRHRTPKTLPKNPQLKRRAWLQRIHGKENNYYDYGVHMVMVAILWKDASGETYSNLLGVLWTSDLVPGNTGHIKFALECAENLTHKPDVLVADRAYDSPEMMRLCRDAGIAMVPRLRHKSKQATWVTLRDGSRVDLNIIWRDLVNHQDGDTKVYEFRDETGQLQRGLLKSTILEVKFDGDTGYVQVLLEAACHLKDGKFEFQPLHAFGVVGAIGWTKEWHRYVYLLRWKIEVLFHIAGLGAPKPRPKNIKTDVLQSFFFLIRIVLAVVMRFRLLVLGRGHHYNGELVEALSVSVLGQVAIGVRIHLVST